MKPHQLNNRNQVVISDRQLAVVTLEQAKQLKALGFDWPVNYYYNNFGCLDEWNHLTEEPSPNHFPSSEGTYECFSAPEVALALKWFSDVKYKPVPPGANFIYEFFIDYEKAMREVFADRFMKQHDTHEAAESAFLDMLIMGYSRTEANIQEDDDSEVQKEKIYIPEYFLYWADRYFDADANLNRRLPLSDVRKDYQENTNCKTGNPTFVRRLRAWCRLKGYHYNTRLYDASTGNPLYFKNDGTPQDRDFHRGVEYVTIGNESFLDNNFKKY